ncbi:MAG TPA: lysophospholipid acyltransferase family protein [Solirubrobacterales bacterium]|jgi:1-acyl-sn-glycerol-3-phosphate acyltransferase|nr:lysophospholipid acyltransferase family protein [Solirubrobacterales bacterium]
MAKVNPKDMKPQVYKDPRPASYFTRFHDSARKGIGFIYDLGRVILTLPTILMFRTRAIGVENVPAHGKVIVTPNHFSQMDHFLVAVYLHRKVQFMAKSQLFGNSLLNFIFLHGGVFPVRRGHNDEEAFKTAHTVLDKGGALLMYAEGGRSRTGDLGEPKRGVGKIALESGAPVVPVAIHGSAHVRGWKRLHFPKVTIQYGEPLSFPAKAHPTREEQQVVANKVFDHVRAMYVDLEENGRRDVLKRVREGLPAGSPEPGAPARTRS